MNNPDSNKNNPDAQNLIPPVDIEADAANPQHTSRISAPCCSNIKRNAERLYSWIGSNKALCATSVVLVLEVLRGYISQKEMKVEMELYKKGTEDVLCFFKNAILNLISSEKDADSISAGFIDLMSNMEPEMQREINKTMHAPCR